MLKCHIFNDLVKSFYLDAVLCEVVILLGDIVDGADWNSTKLRNGIIGPDRILSTGSIGHTE